MSINFRSTEKSLLEILNDEDNAIPVYIESQLSRKLRQYDSDPSINNLFSEEFLNLLPNTINYNIFINVIVSFVKLTIYDYSSYNELYITPNNYDGMTLSEIFESNLLDIQETEKLSPKVKQLASHVFIYNKVILYLPFFDKSESISLDLNQEEVSAINKYSYSYDKLINSSLRKELIDIYTLKIIDNILSALDKAEQGPYLNVRYLYRGDNHIYDDNLVVNLGFTSKTSDPEVALSFSDEKCCIHIYETYMKKFLSIKEYSQAPNEEEYLSYPNEAYTIVDQFKLYYKGLLKDAYLCKFKERYNIKYTIDRQLSKTINEVYLYITSVYENMLLLPTNNTMIFTNGYYSLFAFITQDENFNYITFNGWKDEKYNRKRVLDIVNLGMAMQDNNLTVYIVEANFTSKDKLDTQIRAELKKNNPINIGKNFTLVFKK